MKQTLTNAVIAGMVVSLLVPAHVGWAADGEVEDLRREVRQLQMQVQQLRSVISEIAELDRQRASILSRVARGSSESPAPSSPSRAEAPPTKPAPAPAAPALSRTETTVKEKEKEPSRKPAAAGPAPAPAETALGSIRGKVTVPSGEPVAYVYVENITAAAVKGQKVSIEQVGKKFVPSWAVIQRGTTISFPNKDNIYHNVFSLSSGNSFDLGLYNASSDPKTHTFMEAGAVDIYCNIHPQMAASALVVPNRHFAKVKGDGSYEIAGVPVGRRKVVAWAPGSRLTAEWVEVSSGHASDLNLKLEAKSPGHKNKSGQSYGQYD
jgi:plastocyanin